MSDTLKRLQQIIAKQLAILPEKVSPNADFGKQLGADSLDIIELVMAIEYEFDIDIDDEYASKITTVQDALDYIENKIKQN